jgi:adenylate cyclase
VTEHRAKRKLTAILSADVKGYSRLMGEDELSTVQTLKEYREVISNLVQRYSGRVVDSPGDNILAEFGSVVDALECAAKMQEGLKERNASFADNRRMEFRIGVNLGDVIEDEGRIYGDGVNVAARVEGLAEGGGICISGIAFDSVRNKLNLGYEYLGEHQVKNISEPIRVYKVLTEPEAAGIVIGEEKSKPKRWRLAAVGVALIAVLASLAIWNFYFRAPSIEPVSEKDMAFPLPDKPSIAVLPFANIGDPEQEYITDGITEQIITALARNPRLFVIARNSTFTYKGKPVMVQQVSRELGVRYVVEGSAQRSDDRIRITAQLIDAIKGEHMWAENYDRDLKDIFALQDEITLGILRATMGKLFGLESDLSPQKGTTNVVAYLKYLKARTLVTRNESNNRLARQMCEGSIALDPEFAAAYAVLGMTYWTDFFNGWSKSPGKDLKTASELAHKAIDMDEALSFPHFILGWIYLNQGKHDEAIDEAKKAVALDPSDVMNNATLGNFLAWADQPEEAILVLKHASRLNPFPTDLQLVYSGIAYMIAERFEEALANFKKAQESNPDNMWPYYYQASIYGRLGHEEEARAAAKELLRINPKFSVEFWAKWPGCKNRDKLHEIISGLRKAGLT